MGGATVDFASDKFDSHVKGVISDSGFSRVKDQTRDLVKNKLGGFTPLFMVSVSIWYFLIFHISINKYTDEALKDCKVPFFFIHCKDDTFVNPNNITHHIENYNKNNYYEKWIIPNCPHAIGDFAYPEEYIKKSLAFFLKAKD